MARKRHKKARARLGDGIPVSSSGMGTSCDFGANTMPSGIYGFGSSSLRPGSEQYLLSGGIWDGPFADRFFERFYRTTWEGGKAVDIIADDMTREGWRWTAPDLDAEELKKLSDEEERLGSTAAINQALKYKRTYGGGVVFLGLKGDERGNAAEPVEIDRLSVGDLAWVRAIPRHRISAVDIEQNELSPNYMQPELYTIGAQQVHRSRLMIFGGNPFDYSWSNYRRGDGFGDGIFPRLFQEISNAISARQNIAHLIHKTAVAVIKSERGFDMAGTEAGVLANQKLLNYIQQMSNFLAIMLEKGDDLGTWSASFDGVTKVAEFYLQVLSATLDIPAARFLGEAPGGLNTDGDSQFRSYLGSTIPSRQENELKPQLMPWGQILARTVTGNGIEGLVPEFNPLWTASDTERIENNKKDVESVLLQFGEGLLDDEAAIKILRATQPNWEHLDDSDIQRILQRAKDDAEFDRQEAEADREARIAMAQAGENENVEEEEDD